MSRLHNVHGVEILPVVVQYGEHFCHTALHSSLHISLVHEDFRGHNARHLGSRPPGTRSADHCHALAVV
jgi:hypothetical protein